MSGSCTYIPEVGGELSILYKQLLNKLDNNRPLVNYIYARYLIDGVADAMDADGYSRNTQGQHSVDDIYKFFDITQMLRELNAGTPKIDAITLGVMDIDSNYVDFIDANEAYSKAMSYNASHTGRLAYVVQHGDTFNVIIENIDASNQYKKHLVEAQMLAWDYFKTQVTSSGIDVDTLINVAGEMLTPVNVLDFLDTLHLLKGNSNNVLSVRDIKIFLTIGNNTPQVRTLLSRGWGTLDEVAEKCYNYLQDPTTATPHILSLINSALDASKAVFDPKKVRDELKNTVLQGFETRSESQKIQDILNDLELKYNVGNNDITRATKDINTLEDATAEAITTLTREIRRLEDKGSKTSARTLRRTRETLEQELVSKKYFYGLVQFLDQALTYTQSIRDLLHDVTVNSSGTRLERIRNTAETLSKATSLRDAYYHIVNALTNIESLIVEENMSKADREILQQKAKEIKELLDNQQKLIEELQGATVIDCMGEYLGEESYLGQSYANIVSIIQNDTSITDYLYSVGRSSNDVVATAGAIIREAQVERDRKHQEISVRIKKATKKLYDSGSDSSFMYDDKGYIITEEGIDWDKYTKARKKEFAKLVSLGFRGVTLQDAIDAWELNNTEEKVVDSVSGRTVRIPNGSYRTSFSVYSTLTAAQKEYYHTMMQIKAEMDSLLPPHCNEHHIPPQLRKGWLDVIREGIKGELSATDVAKMLWDRMKFWKVREDEEEFIEGVKYSDYDNTPVKVIPVFYQREVGNKELLHDFSSAIQSLASTALNYDAMMTIQSTIETIQDVVDRAVVEAKTSEGKPVVDNIHLGKKFAKIGDATKKIVIKLLGKKAAESNCSEMLNAYVDIHMYNMKYKGSKKLNKWMNLLLGYNSVTRLAVNLTGATSNIIQGDLQMLVEAGGGKYYNFLHLAKAHARLFGDLVGRTPGKLWDVLSGSRNNIDTLICEFFDTFSDNYADKSRERYYKNPFRRLFGDINAMSVYSMGEGFIRTLNMYAILYKEKVLLNGKKVSLIEAFDRTEKEDGFSDLKLKDGVTKLDGSPLTLEDEYFKTLKLTIKGVGDDCFGAMNSEDKGTIHQHCLGRLAMNFRQWMVEHYSRRFREKHWDYTRKRYIEGYWRTVGRTLLQLCKGYEHFLTEYEALNSDLKEDFKYNCRKAATEFLIWCSLLVLNFAFGDEDDDETWMERWSTLLLKRTLSEFSAGLPTGLFTETYRITQNPLPPLTTITGLIYPITGIINGDLFSRDDMGNITWTRIESGRYAGWNKYVRNLLWYTVPFYKQIDQLSHLTEEDSLYMVYERNLK